MFSTGFPGRIFAEAKPMGFQDDRHKRNVMEKTVVRSLYLFLLLGTNASIFNTQDQAVPFVPPAGDFL
ncbi:hypothetical protein Q8A67_024154 [Cirrhinus molitorella]|uniref:Uncharacterized protein n=1 Tax=Cirrhinus molitorella TaxID=172907 RepID=A0AA88TA73_9TELE|nr:hypothetical protein Q8A67_024154 [Cirrhinus molitorella]